MQNLIIREYKRGDEEQIIALHNKTFNQNRTIEQWKWQYMDNPAGEAIISVICDNEKIIGHFSIIPIYFREKNLSILTGKAEGAMVDKKYRFYVAKKKIFKELVSCTINIAFEKKIEFVWGLTNTPKEFLNVGFKYLGKIDCMQKNCSLKYKFFDFYNHYKQIILKGKSRKLNYSKEKTNVKEKKVSKSIEISLLSNCNSQMSEFWSSQSKKYGLTIDRAEEYLVWRFNNNPFKKSKILIYKNSEKFIGYLIISIVEKDKHRKGYLIDVLFDREDSHLYYNKLKKEINKFARSENIDFINCYSLTNAPHAETNKTLEKIGFRKGGYDEIDMIGWFNSKKKGARSLNLSDFYITMIFTEGVFG